MFNIDLDESERQNGIYLPELIVESKKIESIDKTSMFEDTVEQFERVRRYGEIGRKVLDSIERAMQAARGRRRMPVLAFPSYFDGYTLISPVATLDNGSGSFCISAEADFDFYMGREMPLAAMVTSYASTRISLNRVRHALTDVTEVDRAYSTYHVEQIDYINRSTALTPDLEIGLSAVYLALKSSY